MPNTIQIITESKKEREVLESIFRNLGADAVFSQDLNDALSIFERTRPRAVFLVDGQSPPAEVQIRELLRVAPFLPIVVLLKKRDASKAVAYMKAGAFDCAQSPWTEEEIKPLFKKALNISGTTIKLDPEQFNKSRTLLALSAVLIAAIFGFVSGWIYSYTKYNAPKPVPSIVELPYSHPSGLAFDKDSLIATDWYNQALYRHDISDLRITGVFSFPDTVPVGLASNQTDLWLVTAGGTIERRMKNERLSILSTTKPSTKPPTGACYDGLYVWLADGAAGKISKHLANEGLSELRTFSYPGSSIAAFTCDSRFLWLADEGLRSLVKISPEDPETIISRTELPQYSSKTLKIRAMAARNGKIWFAAEDKGKGWLFNVAEPR